MDQNAGAERSGEIIRLGGSAIDSGLVRSAYVTDGPEGHPRTPSTLLMSAFFALHERALSARAQAARWYACYTRARHEKQVDRILQQRGMESFLPLVRRRRQWKDRETMVSFPLFPSYIFARFSLSHLHAVLSIPGVAEIVRNDGQPVAIADEEIENVRRFAAVASTGANQIEMEMVSLPGEGDRVRIISGPFQGIDGIVVQRRGRSRVVVGLVAIGQGLEVEVPAAALDVLPV